MANMKKSGPKMPPAKRLGAKPVPLPTPPARQRRGTPVPLGTPPARPTGKRLNTRPVAPGKPKKSPIGAKQKPLPKTTKKGPGKMTPQDAAMKKILESKYGKIYG
jgi:hypothetical protein